ncbi:oligosaccharide flippase family protein [Clostridium sp. MT-14]|jgi:O-antigen/teichoic acid export membrane protein|uniref:Oligosaccharide flippase family protein n=1 Tax=Clostridium aromativorans TaxID=2836848 RepID=A0ABS8N7W4_9CLOT|nr:MULTISPECIES: oligosaccharide flippase family protein [Clostridium]KAA8675771.1 oligosaccharide flippase family protein [Clostridium sp. HV4-5-A1G]MCC9295898.1 oligosaccharide flippase family protein [Clostridium aromativorans]CAB1251628.1 Polysaccharide biosynthesis export protein [Clostridiaceae bacterium BL-3]
MKDASTIKLVLKKGLVQIFSANFVNKVIQFGIMFFMTRILGKKLYGDFTYAQNILNIFLTLEGLGMVSSSLQYCSMEKREDRRLSYFKYAVKIGSAFNLLIAISIIVYTVFFKLPVEGSTQMLFYLSAIPLMTIFFNEIQTLLRAELRNNEFSLLTITNTLLYFFGNVCFGYYFSVNGIIAGRYMAYIISIIIGIYLIRNQVKKIAKIAYPAKEEKRDFLKYSVVSCLTNAMSQLLYLMDTFFVGAITKSSEIIASYNVAMLIPFNLMFIPMSILTFAYPYFARHWDDRKWIKDKYYILVKYLFILNIFITIVLIVFAPFIVETVFTKQYSDSITNFRILTVGYLIAGTFRIPSGNVLASMKLVKVNFYNSMITGIVNIVLNIVLITKFGSIGASLSTVSTYILSSIISNVYLRKYVNE